MKNIKVDFFSESKKWPRRIPKIKNITKKTINKMSSYFKRDHKFELNIILTDKSKMIKLNKTYKNLMVDLKTSNNKLTDRAIRIICELTKLDYEESKKLLIKAKNNVKIAVVMHTSKVSYASADRKIKLNDGSLRKSMK